MMVSVRIVVSGEAGIGIARAANAKRMNQPERGFINVGIGILCNTLTSWSLYYHSLRPHHLEVSSSPMNSWKVKGLPVPQKDRQREREGERGRERERERDRDGDGER